MVFPVLLLACHNKQIKIHPTVENISESVYASGVVKGKNQYQVYSTVNGIIKEIYVTEGENVKKGTSLFLIFNKTAQLNTKNAQLAADFARLSSNQDKLNESLIAVSLAKSKLNNDSLLWQRQKNLWQQNIGTSVELEQREYAYKIAKTNYQTSIIHHKDLNRQLELSAKQSQNTLEINQTLTEEYIIKSEVEGKVYSILKKKGELINTQNPIAVVGSIDFLLELQVDEYDITRIKENQNIFIKMDSYKGQVFEASVIKINPIMSERSKSFIVEAEFVTPPSVLYPFLTAEANIVIQSKQNALIIPRSFLIGDTVVITEENKKKKVVIGLKDYQKAEIVSGLTPNEYILKPTN
jgi:multidrug efflux pump subunit AcrA (membrane-fusion protein)